jgi:hypothetical protein
MKSVAVNAPSDNYWASLCEECYAIAEFEMGADVDVSDVPVGTCGVCGQVQAQVEPVPVQAVAVNRWTSDEQLEGHMRELLKAIRQSFPLRVNAKP